MADTSAVFSAFATSMLDNAEWQLDQPQYAAAIVLAQAAVEMAASEAFTRLILGKIEEPADRVLALVPDLSFMDKRTRDFWTALTGTKINEPKPVWKRYHEHVERRNRVAHGQAWGDAGGGREARKSVAAARAFMDRMAADL